MSSSMGLAPPLPIPTQPSATSSLPPITGTGPPNIPSLSSQLLPPAPPQPPPYPPSAMSMYNNGNNNGLLYGEEISTIFVVGFPDDMQEREFQNMFIFSPGFEAATLKVPSKDGDEDPNVSTVNGNPQNKKQIIGFAKFRSRGEALDAKDTISGRKVDAEKGSVLKAEMAKKNLHTKRGLSSNDPFQLNQLPAILPSHELLQQQNIHHSSIPPLPPPPSYQQQQEDNSSTLKRSTGPHHSSVYEAFHSVPASDPTLISDIYSDLFIPNNTNNATIATTTTNASSTAIRSIQPLSTTTIASITGNNNSTRLSGLFSPTHRFSSGNIFDLPQRSDNKPLPPLTTSSLPNTDPVDLLEKVVDPPISQANPSSLAAETTASLSSSSSLPQALQQQNIYHYPHHPHPHHQQQQQPLHLQSTSPPPPPPLTNRFMDDEQQQQLGSAFGGLTINTNSIHSTNNIINTTTTTTSSSSSSSSSAVAAAATTTTSTSLTSTPTTNASNSGLPSPGLLSPNGYRSFSTMMMMASTNPADQNPPCNTLYVGNLPPNTDEEELKQLFSNCVGYKRLSFRQKANGPMCFVEFDDVYCATMALQDLYGNPLSNSVKGGIRLSFSKNPLGVRQNSISNSGCNATNGVFNPSVVPYYRDNLFFDPPYS